MVEAVIIDACRTPRGIGKPGKGALSSIHPQRLGSTVLKALAERNPIDTSKVDDIVWGTQAQMGPQSADLGRMCALDTGYDIRSSAVTLDRFCGSGITAVSIAAAPRRVSPVIPSPSTNGKGQTRSPTFQFRTMPPISTISPAKSPQGIMGMGDLSPKNLDALAKFHVQMGCAAFTASD